VNPSLDERGAFRGNTVNWPLGLGVLEGPAVFFLAIFGLKQLGLMADYSV